jgi:WhiB family redox-sensing transcriptional regulator
MTTTTSTSTSTRTVTVDGVVWWSLAACRTVDPETFYPVDLAPRSDGVRRARRVCTSCPVLPECLADVMASEDPARRWGVIGGTTPDERTALYARQRTANPDATGAAA